MAGRLVPTGRPAPVWHGELGVITTVQIRIVPVKVKKEVTSGASSRVGRRTKDCNFFRACPVAQLGLLSHNIVALVVLFITMRPTTHPTMAAAACRGA